MNERRLNSIAERVVSQHLGPTRTARPVMKIDDVILAIRNIDEGRLDADSYEGREVHGFLAMKAARLQDVGKYLETRAKEFSDFIATDGGAHSNMLGYLRKALERLRRDGLI